MKKFKTLVVDDERLAREELKKLLSGMEEVDVVGEAKNGKEAMEMIQNREVDLLFLDVNMPGMSGFELLEQLDEIPYVIFVTAYDKFAIKAFEVDALDYILKPIEKQRLQEAVEKLRELEKAESELPNNVALSRKGRALTLNDSVFIKDGNKCWFVELSKVRMLESDGNYVKVYFDEHKPMLLRSLNSFEEQLDAAFFFRANRKFIVNTKWISSIKNWFNGGLQVELLEGEKIKISRRQAIRFKEAMGL